MSVNKTVIKYNCTGEYGTIIQRELMVIQNATTDITTIIEDGKELFSYDDTIDGNIMESLSKLLCSK
jgi:hypothetical protein